MDIEGDFTIWRRVILILIGVFVIAGILGALYAWYEEHLLNANNSDTFTNTQPPTSVQQQQNTIKSLTAPTFAATTSASVSSGTDTHPYTPAPAPKPPAALTAPPPKTSAPQQPDQATINSLTAPSK